MSKATELRDKTVEELQELLAQALRAQFSLRMQKGSGQLGKPSEIRKTRRTIARIMTILNERIRFGVQMQVNSK